MTYHKMLGRMVILGAFLIALGISGTAEANFVVNGSFEEPSAEPEPDGIVTVTAPGSFPGWSVLSGSVDLTLQTTGPFVFNPAYDGVQVLDLNGTAAGSIEQSFATLSGLTYLLTFAYANNPDGGSSFTASALVEVLGDTTLLSDTIEHSGSQHGSVDTMDYILYSASFTADSAETTLRFTSTNTGAFGIFLDGVSVVSVPEPGSLALCGLGLLGLLGVRYCRRGR